MWGRDRETVQVTLQREWGALAKTAELRRTAAGLLLDHLLSTLPPGTRGTDLPAMTILLKQEQRGFARADFASLQLHYDEQIRQIHVMAEYAQHGLSHTADHLKLAMDYFILPEKEFLDRWLPDRDQEISRQTTRESWRAIVESLNNPNQRRMVADDREQTNVLILAGPGSGRTRVLVHRIAYLIRVKRENPRGILALAYNRHAAVEIRRRLENLVGDDARGITVLTCHALAMRLVGASFAGRANRLEQGDFQDVIRQAVVDSTHQVIVAARAASQSSDKQQAVGMIEETISNTGAVPKEVSADAGYYSAKAVDDLQALGVDPYVAPEQTRHGRVVPPAPRGRIPRHLSPRDRMRRKLQTRRGRQRYALRMETVEPVFGQIKQGRGFRQFLLRGLDKVNGEWSLICTGHNLLKLFRCGRLAPG